MKPPAELITKVRSLPNGPGCYLMRDRAGRIIYIGKARSLRQRVGSYFRRATLLNAAPKLRGLIRSIADIEVLPTSDETAAVLTEARLIRDYRPKFNALLKDDKRFPLVRVATQTPFPRLQLCRLERQDGALYLGPYASSGALRTALDFAEKRFGLRKCPAVRPGHDDHCHCINDIVRHCSAPCLGKIGEAEYGRRLSEAIAFLNGERSDILEELKAAMRAAADRREFERAAALRDAVELLQHGARRRRHRHPRALPGLAAEICAAGLAELQKVLELAGPPRLLEAYDISSISGRHAVGSLVVSQDGRPLPAHYRRFRVTTAVASDDAGMLAEVIFRRFGGKTGRPNPAAMPDLILVDGGAPQLRSAAAALENAGQQLPAIGLAKRREEVYRLAAAGPRIVGFPPHSPAVLVLQSIRDEAHRFAHAYHLRLRAKRIRESLLDQLPDIGPVRKRLLLSRFGSVAALARADPDELAGLPGIGRARAARILAAIRNLRSGLPG